MRSTNIIMIQGRKIVNPTNEVYMKRFGRKKKKKLPASRNLRKGCTKNGDI